MTAMPDFTPQHSVLVRLVNRRNWEHVWTGRFATVPRKGDSIDVHGQGWMVDPHPESSATHDHWVIEGDAHDDTHEAALLVELRKCRG